MVSIVEQEDKQKPKGIMIRTVIKESVYNRLQALAQQYQTGRGDWDFGVAIEILLDFWEQSKLGQINDKLDFLISSLESKEEPEKKEEKEDVLELLGGNKVSKK